MCWLFFQLMLWNGQGVTSIISYLVSGCETLQMPILGTEKPQELSLKKETDITYCTFIKLLTVLI